MRLLDGSNVTGAQSLFDAVHPVGTGGSVNVEDIEIDWKQGSPRKPAQDIHKLRANYVLTSSSPPDRRDYNTELKAVAAHAVIESTGTSHAEVENISFGIGTFRGDSAVGSLLESE